MCPGTSFPNDKQSIRCEKLYSVGGVNNKRELEVHEFAVNKNNNKLCLCYINDKNPIESKSNPKYYTTDNNTSMVVVIKTHLLFWLEVPYVHDPWEKW